MSGRAAARPAASEEAYDRALQRALDALPSRVDASDAARRADEARAAALAEIARVSPSEARARAAALDAERLAGVARALVSAADQLAIEEPAAGVALAGVALAAADAGSQSESDLARSDLRAAARRCLAEAAFRAGDLVAAEGTAAEGVRWARLGTGDPRLRAELLRVAAEIRSDQSRFSESRRLLARAVALLERAGESRLEGRARVSLAMKMFLDGRTSEALAENARALALLDSDRDPRWRLAAEFNHAFWSCETGDTAAVRSALGGLRDRADRQGSEHDRVCVAWLEARVTAREGRADSAVELYRRVLARCLELDTTYDSAAVALELAVLLLELGRADEVLPLADAVAPIFRAQGVEPEAAAAVLLAAESLRRGIAAREVLRTLVATRPGARGAR